MRPVWAAAVGGRPVGRLLQKIVAVLGWMWWRRCGSCRGTRSENETGGGEVEVGAVPRPSRHLETFLTETWKRRTSSQLVNNSERTEFPWPTLTSVL